MHRPRRTRSFLTNRPCFPPTTSSPHRISKPPFTCISPSRTRNIRSTCSNILSMLSLCLIATAGRPVQQLSRRSRCPPQPRSCHLGRLCRFLRFCRRCNSRRRCSRRSPSDSSISGRESPFDPDSRSRQSTAAFPDELGVDALPGNLNMSRRGSAGAEDAADDEDLDPDEMSKKDPLATQVWKMYAKQRSQLPNGARMENLTWRMMAMTLRKKKEQEAAEAKLALEAQSNASRSHASSARHSPTLSSKSAGGSRRSSGSFPGDPAAFAGGFTAIQRRCIRCPGAAFACCIRSRCQRRKRQDPLCRGHSARGGERGRRGRSPRTPESAATPAGAVDIVDWRMKSKSRSRSRSVSAMDVDWRGVSRSRSRAPMRLDTIDDEGNMDGAALFSRSAPNANAFDGFNFADLAQFDGTDAFGAFDSALDTDDFSDLLRPTAPTLPTCPVTGALPPAAVHAEPRAPHARCRCRMPSAARLTRTSSGPSRTHGRPQKRIFSSR